MKYTTPETRCLQINAQSVICMTSGGAPERKGNLGTMTVKVVDKWI